MAASTRRAAARRTAARASGPASLDVATAAWLAAAPTTLLVVLAMLLLGPAFGSLLPSSDGVRFWSDMAPQILRPEPAEQARFLLAITAPLVLVALTILLVRRPPRFATSAGATLAAATELLAVAVLVGCFVSQRTYAFSVEYVARGPHVVYFTIPTLLVATAIAVLLVAGARSNRVRARFAEWTQESHGRRAAAVLIALALIAITLLPAINTDSSISRVNADLAYHLQFTFDETAAVLDGRSPLGDFAAQYASLWPYLVAGAMSIFSTSLGAFTVSMAVITGVGLLALFDILRRVTRRSASALLLFLPLLATSAYRLHGSSVDRFSLANYFGTMPFRYVGPFMLAWLTARHLDGVRPRRAWPLFVLGGLVAINNVDFGIAAVGATLAALLWAGGRPTAATLRRLAAEAGIGLAAAVVIVTLLVLARTGDAPDFSLALRYARVFATGGFAMLPVRPVVGLSTIVFLTYVAAIAVASVRAMREEQDRLLTGLLAWSGVFGLGAGSYYAGRSIPEVLTNMFPAWALALTLLTIVALRQLAGASDRRPAPIAVACLFGFGLLVCSLAQTPAPWSQFDRIARQGPPTFAQPPGQEFVAGLTRPGEQVAVLMQLGHRMAVQLGIDNVSPYTGSQSIQTEEQMADVVDALRRAGGRKLFLSFSDSGQAMVDSLPAHGFKLTVQDQSGLQLWERP